MFFLKFLSLLIFLLLNIELLYSKTSDLEYLQKLLSNGYYDVAEKYCYDKKDTESDVKLFLLNLLEVKDRYDEIINIVGDKTDDMLEIQFLAEAYIFTKRFDDLNSLMLKIKERSPNTYSELTNLSQGIFNYFKYNNDEALKYLLNIKLPSKKVKGIIAKIYLLKNDPDAAKKFISDSKTDDSYLFGYLKYKLGKYEEAISVLKKIPKSKDSTILLFNSYMKLNKFKEAKELYHDIDKIESDKFYENLKLLLAFKKYDEVELMLRDKEDSPDKYYYMGQLFFAKGLYEEAITALNKSIALGHSGAGDVYILLAEANEKVGAYIFAKDFYQKVLTMPDVQPFHSDAIFKIGFCFYKIGDYKESEKFLLKYINLTSDNSKYINDANKLLPIVYDKNGKYSESINFLERMKALSKDKKQIKSIDLTIASLWEKLDKHQFAIEVYLKYLPIKDKDDFNILKKLGELYYKCNDFKSSNIYYEEYLAKTKQSLPEISLKIALNSLYLDKIDIAKSDLKKVVDTTNSGVYKEEALFWLGKISYREKDYKSAISYFDSLYKVNSNSILLENTKEYLASLYMITNDKENFIKYFKNLSNPARFIKEFQLSFEDICKFINCQKELVYLTSDETKYQYFKKLYPTLKSKKDDELYGLLSNRYLGNDILTYYYIGNILSEKGAKDKSLSAYAKFLDNEFNPVFYSHYKEVLYSVLKYYYDQKNYEKVVSFDKIYSRIKDLSENELYIIGVSNNSLGLNHISADYFRRFINVSKTGNNLFNAAFLLDKMDYLNDAKIGYEKAINFLKDDESKIEALYWVGEIHYKQENYVDALDSFLRIKLLYPFDIKWTPTAAFNVAKILEKMGETDKAIKEYQNIVKNLQNNDPRKSFLLKKLEELKRGGVERIKEDNTSIEKNVIKP